METLTHSTLAMLAVINPFVCGAMLLQAELGKDKKSRIIAGVKAMLVVLVILLTAAIAGRYILSAFGISMDAFKVVGGIILAYIGFTMFSTHKSENSQNANQDNLTKLIMFAASPGTISMVITLAVVHNKEGLPVLAMAGSTLAVALTIVIIITMLLLKKKTSTGDQGIMSKFMGLIIVAIGLQFMLDGIKHFFGV